MQATELYDICRGLAEGEPTAEAVHRMHEVLTLCCVQGTQGKGAFGNLFSQVDFLCKQYGIAAADKVAIQTMRRHSKQDALPSAEDWLYDLRALALLISAVFSEAIPGVLLGLLPAKNRPAPSGMSIDRECVRCIVRRWDGETIWADTEKGEVKADYGSTEGGRNLGYLQKILREGMQLNLIDCHQEKGVLTPRLIVVEPDYLVDVSSIAACFTPYGHHPLLYTVNRLKARPNTQAILLGNFAGTALDDVVKNPSHSTLQSSLRRSFQEQAMRFCACEGFDAERFKRDASVQMQNIREAVAWLASQNQSANTLFLLEPSFVCERLGLQGRVDLMTGDMALLVEQKAGKNPKIERQSHDPHGLQTESHYVQLLLYYGILRYNFGRTDQSVDMRLLYSRYPAAQGLLSVNYYRTLFREAIRLRNQIVATELLIAREGFGRVLPLLSPAFIYKDVKPDGYFTQYVLPELSALASAFSRLTPLERAYFERMATFVYREQILQKLGSASTRLYHSGGAASDLWQMSLEEKKETGNIIAGLAVSKLAKSTPLGGYDLITLSGTLDASLNFRRGDMVLLYSYREQPDAGKGILYKGTLDEIAADQVVVRLNDGQQDRRAFLHARWAVEHGSTDLMATTSLRSLCQFVFSESSRRDLLLGQRNPEADLSLRLSRSYHPVYDGVLLKAKQARDYFLLIGPPGTGKTSQALRYMLREERGSRLLMAYTNRAVDEICAMLDNEGWDYLRLGNESSCDPRFRSHLLSMKLGSSSGLADIRQLIEQVPIVVGTTSTLASRQEVFRLKHFSLTIVDEASQILEPGLIGLLSLPETGRFVLVGDYKQLPAVVQQSEADALVTDPNLRSIGLNDCRQSLFERLIRWERHCGRTQFIGALDHQGRMHPEVAQFPCTHFYVKENLQPVPLVHQKESGLLYQTVPEDELDEVLRQQRVLFFDQEGGAAALLRRVHRLCGKEFSPLTSAGVIVTYRNQITQIRQEIAQIGIPELCDVCIDTVERYQGSQRDVIIYDFGINNLYQLDFLTANTFMEDGLPIDRKLNVAMTRARRQLILIGRASLLRHNPLLRELIDSTFASTACKS